MTESGKEFQMVGPADLNPREPNTVEHKVDLHQKSGEHAKEHKDEQGMTDMMGLWHGVT